MGFYTGIHDAQNTLKVTIRNDRNLRVRCKESWDTSLTRDEHRGRNTIMNANQKRRLPVAINIYFVSVTRGSVTFTCEITGCLCNTIGAK